MRKSRDTVLPADIGKIYISPAKEWTSIVICSAINIVLLIMLWNSSGSCQINYSLFGIIIDNYIFNGLTVQGQLFVNTYLSIRTMKKGFIAAVLLNILGICLALSFMITGNQNTLTGIITYLGSIIIAIVIYYYKKGLFENLKVLTEQKEEITSLYEELTSSQEKLRQQNEQLIKYTSVMKTNAKKLERMAYYDVLTGLPNRKMIIKKLDQLIRCSSQIGSGFSLIYIDIDNFKEINDLMGHQIGDMILKAVASCWKSKLNSRDLLGRLGGDEFAVIIRRDMSREEILEYVNRLKDAVSDVFKFNTREFNINASYGISVYPEDGGSTEDLMKHADMAMAVAKSSGKNGIEFYRNEMQKNMLERVRLEDGLKSAILNDELYVVFQPQYYCNDRRIRGFEALARWQSSTLGQVSPVQFIAVAEQTGLIIDIGEWILRTVLKKFMEIQSSNMKDYVLTINISVVQLIQPSFVKMVRNVLKETNFDSRHLEFEITESVLISYPEKVIETLDQLKKMGIRIALDDFGTGYASLKYLQLLPIDTLKIDRTFVSRIGEQDSGDQIVGMLISLAHSLDLIVVAEGVENTNQLKFLKEHHCDCVQGFLLSRPLEDDKFAQLIATA